MKAIGATAVLYPKTASDNLGQGKAKNAIDGFSHVGETGAFGASYCAWGLPASSSYLRVDLRANWLVKVIGLFLRDESWRQYWQNGLEVSVSTEADLQKSIQCGRSYDNLRDGGNPVFRCDKVTRYIWIVHRVTKQLQVCEIEVFEGIVEVKDKLWNLCYHPSAILDGNLTLSGLSVGSVATYQCKEGLYLVGPSQIECQATGSWSHEPPLCTSKLNSFSSSHLLFIVKYSFLWQLSACLTAWSAGQLVHVSTSL